MLGEKVHAGLPCRCFLVAGPSDWFPFLRAHIYTFKEKARERERKGQREGEGEAEKEKEKEKEGAEERREREREHARMHESTNCTYKYAHLMH